MNEMTSSERGSLMSLIRQRERVAKASAAERAAELMADFEAQMAREFSFSEDATWKLAMETAHDAVTRARTMVQERCKELGIPKAFAPDIGDVVWYRRGQNAVNERRTELRHVAKTRIDAALKSACAKIAKHSVETQETLIASGFSTDAARGFLANMPTVEALMPTLLFREVEQLATNRFQLAACG